MYALCPAVSASMAGSALFLPPDWREGGQLVMKQGEDGCRTRLRRKMEAGRTKHDGGLMALPFLFVTHVCKNGEKGWGICQIMCHVSIRRHSCCPRLFAFVSPVRKCTKSTRPRSQSLGGNSISRNKLTVEWEICKKNLATRKLAKNNESRVL